MRWRLLVTLLWLRWRLSRNQLRRAGRFRGVLVAVLTLIASGAALGALATGYFLGRFPLARAGGEPLLYVIDGVVAGFLLFWIVGVLAEIQRSESIDLQRLMNLPVTLRDAFLVNFAVSHVTPSVLLALPFVTGLSAGLAAGRDGRLLVLWPLFLGFLFFVSGWTYCLRGWLVQLMINPRRRRTIVVVLTMSVILAGQIPNLYFNILNRQTFGGGQPDPEEVQRKLRKFREASEQLHFWLPPLWVGWGTTRAADGSWWRALGATVLLVAGGAAGLHRAYSSTVRFYRGEGKVRQPASTRKRRGGPRPETRPLESRIPGFADDVSGAAAAFLRSMLRAPELKMALLGPVLMLGVLAMVFMGRGAGDGVRRAAPLVAIGVTVFSFTGLLQVAFNQFGWDRTGFRALVLLPTRRPDLLLAKNLAAGVIMLVLGLAVYSSIAAFLRIPWLDHAAGWLQVTSAIIMLCVLGNFLSIMMPVRMNTGSLKPTKMPVAAVLVMMVLTLLLPVYLLPVMVGPALGFLAGLAGTGTGQWLNLGCSLLLLLVVMGVYALTLKPMGRLFWEREQKILDTVTAEIE